jgi:hypothetical protein
LPTLVRSASSVKRQLFTPDITSTCGPTAPSLSVRMAGRKGGRRWRR